MSAAGAGAGISAIGSYLLFGLLWWSIDAWDPECVSLLNTFNEALLFSIETQTTIGYGSKHVQGDCSVGIALLMTQSITGLLIDVIVFGLLYSKVTKPARRVIMLRVSHDALIGERDGERQLMIRVGDMRKRGGLTAVEAKLFMVFEHTTTEGEYIPFHAAKLEVDEDSVSNEPMLAIPWTVAHKIDEDSPLCVGMPASALPFTRGVSLCLALPTPPCHGWASALPPTHVASLCLAPLQYGPL